MRYVVSVLVVVLFSVIQLVAQDEGQKSLVQFSGMVLDGTNDNLLPIPYANILVKGKGRGTYTDLNGFFSIVVEQGDVIAFSAIGYESVEFEIPDTLLDQRYSIVQLMTVDAINLPETVVFPWPSREHFKLEFLAMNTDDVLSNRAQENLSPETLARVRNQVLSDGNENADFYLRQQAGTNYYIGQQPPMNIFNPVAWKKFFDSWKRGDYKKKNNGN